MAVQRATDTGEMHREYELSTIAGDTSLPPVTLAFVEIIFALLAGAFLLALAWSLIARYRRMWRGATPLEAPIVHLDARMAVRPTILGHTPPDGYRLAALYFGTGLIDRTGKLDCGFPYEARHPIPERVEAPDTDGGMFARLCDRRARDIVGRARREGKAIHLLWSGGIDSTCACVSLLRALGDTPMTVGERRKTATSELDRLIIYETHESQREYPAFAKRVLSKRIKRRTFKHVGEAFSDKAITVTGEFGDQMFGSAKALGLSFDDLREDWRTALPKRLNAELGSRQRAASAMRFLAPHIADAPVPIEDLFTCLWWLNFSLKWQAVHTRMFASVPNMTFAAYENRVAHFFATDDFQVWALSNAGRGIGTRWSSYKWPARQVITAFTGDAVYAAEKNKVPSLKGLIRPGVKRAAIAVTAAGATLYQPLDYSLKTDARAGGASPSEYADVGDSDGTGWSFEVSIGDDPMDTGCSSFDEQREAPLWDDLSDGE
ncbi:MAG: hypothetical protein AAFR55_09665 [Pseudomonadota bacterium]